MSADVHFVLVGSLLIIKYGIAANNGMESPAGEDMARVGYVMALYGLSSCLLRFGFWLMKHK